MTTRATGDVPAASTRPAPFHVDDNAWPADTQHAVLNVLEDLTEERERADATQRAILNILDDAARDRGRTDDTQRAILNILDDFGGEKERLESTQKAVLNILEDFDTEKVKVDEANEDLRSEIGERNRAELALEDRTEALARSNAELEMFAYAASHDLAEPLRAIAGPATLIARRYKGKLDEDADELIGFITDGCERMHALITDLLTYSRVGRMEEQWHSVDCNVLVRRVLSILAPAIDDADATVTVGSLPTVVGEPTQLAQVFQNLIANALKFKRAGVAATISIEGGETDDGWSFSVTDNGIGIEPRHRERIFGMFKRLHPRDEYPGTGIGLALVKKIVERHGGTIGADDAPGELGTSFSFTIRSTSPSERP